MYLTQKQKTLKTQLNHQLKKLKTPKTKWIDHIENTKIEDKIES